MVVEGIEEAEGVSVVVVVVVAAVAVAAAVMEDSLHEAVVVAVVAEVQETVLNLCYNC